MGKYWHTGNFNCILVGYIVHFLSKNMIDWIIMPIFEI